MQFLHKAFEKHARNRLFDGIISASYQEAYDAITLEDRFNEGQLALVLISEGVDGVLAYLSCVLNGMIPLLLPENIGLEAIKDFLARYKPEVLILRNLYDTKELVNYSFSTYPILGRTFTIGELREQDLAPIKGISLLIPTSGSTGDPKVVKLSEKSVQINSLAICDALNLTAVDSVSLVLPINYSFGISIINTHIQVGSKIICSDKSILERGFWDVFSKCDTRCFYGVPYHFQLLKKFNIFGKLSSEFRFFAQAGGSLNFGTKQWFLQKGIEFNKQFYIMYGQTECSPRVSCFNLIINQDKIESVGKPIKNCVVQIMNPSESSIGELCITGENVFCGYAHERGDLYDFNMGLKSHHSGDLGYIDQDGYLYLTGRMKRNVKIRGHNVNLDRIETMLRDVTEDVAVVSSNEIISIHYVGNHGSVKEMQAIISDNLTIPPGAIRFVHTVAITKTPSGKINYKLLEIGVSQ